MKLQDLHPDVRCLPQTTAIRVVAYGKERLEKHDIYDFTTSAKKNGSRSPIPPPIEPSEMEVDTLLGKGSFGAAYALDDHFAIKVLQPDLLMRPHIFANCAADLVIEGMILQTLQHPHIVKCYSMGDLKAFANGRHDSCVLVLDRLQCTLKDRLREWQHDSQQVHPSSDSDSSIELATPCSRRTLCSVTPRRREHAISERINILCELADAVQYLHTNRIIHRDLKPENLGLSDEGRLKIFDFGVCRILPQEASNRPEKTYRFTRNIGTRRYMAPEVARGDEYNAKSDVYSFGLICYEVLSLETPHEDIPAKVLTQLVAHEGLRPSLPQTWPRPVKSLLQRCWNERMSSRPTMRRLCSQIRSTMDLMVGPSDRKQASISGTRMSSLQDETDRTERTCCL